MAIAGLLRLFTLAFVLSPALGALAWGSPIQDLKPEVKRPTEVLVLATTHLTGVEALQSSHMDGLHEALKGYAPQAIVVEQLDSRVIDAMLARRQEYGAALQTFVGERFLAQSEQSRQLLGIDGTEARRRLGEACRPLPAEGEALQDCMRLAAAGHEQAWFDYMAYRYQRRFGRASAVRDMISERGLRNERYSIAARLAEALGHDRVYAMDDQLEYDQFVPLLQTLQPALEGSAAMRSVQSSELVTGTERRLGAALEGGDLLPFYLWMNSPAYGERVIQDEWRLFVDSDLPPQPAARRLALWDVRNLAMVSRIMRVAAEHPGERILVVVGASHKVFFDDYLAVSIGVRIRQLEEFAHPGE